MVTVSRLSDELWKANIEHLGVRDISRRAKELGVTLSPSNISNYLRGNHPENPPERTLAAFAKVFGVPLEDLQSAATFTGREPFVPDPSADRLTPPQRTVLNELIRVMTDANEKGGEGSAGDPAPMNPAGGSPAPNNVTPFPETQAYTDPPPASETAAKHGKNRGRSIRRKQDEDAERPDPDHSED